MFDLKHLASTIRKKLVLEIAGLEVEPPDTAPVQFAEAPANPSAPGLVRVQLKLPTTKMDCFAGENALGGGGFRGGRFPDQ